MFSTTTDPICGPPSRRWVAPLVLIALLAVPAQAAWVDFVEQTNGRLNVSAALGASDPREKDYAWADLDKDGDIDLVIARKQPFTSNGKDPNLLLINEGGVLTDRTADFATSTDVIGDLGFMTPTNDRDITIVDVDNDGWLDVVTAPTYQDSDPDTIGHPRVYMNRGCTGACEGTDDWLGLRFEQGRVPALLSHSGQAGFQPRFCAVAAGDVNADGYADLWFVDYDNGQPAGADFNNKLLLNHGALNPGFFHDVTEEAFNNSGFEIAAFGASGYLEDVNGDGFRDVLKQHAGEARIAYNDSADPGFFDTFQTPYNGAVYFLQVGELNNDDQLDLIMSDDGQDRYLLNQGNAANGTVNWFSQIFSYQHASGLPFDASDDDGFGGNSIATDLNNDGFKDVLITDVDVDIGGCSRRMHIFRNLGGPPGSSVTLQEQTEGSGCPSFNGNPASCIVNGIPSNQLEGVHDVAVFDIDGDGWKDMVVGRCGSTEIYINSPPITPAAGAPDGSTIPGPMLEVDKNTAIGLTLTLDWGDSCQASDGDYAVYEGTIGDFTSHERITCTTSGLTSHSFGASEVTSNYYLAVPTNGSNEGSYGRNSAGNERPGSTAACRPQAIGSCDDL